MKINKLTLQSKLFVLTALAQHTGNLNEILKHLSSLETFKDRIDYAEKHLEHLSSGSSRLIYKVGDQVLKLAKNERGVAQNKVEANPKMKSKYINPTIKADKNGIWKLSPYLEKITEKEFEKMTGFNFKEFGKALEHKIDDEEKPEHYEEISKSEIFKEFIRLTEDFDLLIGDMIRISSFGKKDDHVILLDAGLDNSVWEKFYNENEKSS